jgi:hypothetical protein
MRTHCTPTIGLLVVVFVLIVFPTACCGGNPTPQPSASATPEVATPTLPEATLQAALPTASGTSDPTTAQPAATLPPVFDLTRTEDNPITDAQQIIEILEALEHIERAQPVPPGWYLRTNINPLNPEDPEHSYGLYHVMDENLNCDLMMNFVLAPDENVLWRMARDYGTLIHTFSGGQTTLDIGATEDNYCNLSNPNFGYFSAYSDTFSITAYGWQEDEGIVGFSFSAWFEYENDQPIFVLQENTDVYLGYVTDPDTNERVLVRSEETKKTYAVDTGFTIQSSSTMFLENNKTIDRASLAQREYYAERAELPSEVLTYLDESLLKYDELQLP